MAIGRGEHNESEDFIVGEIITLIERASESNSFLDWNERAEDVLRECTDELSKTTNRSRNDNNFEAFVLCLPNSTIETAVLQP